METKNVLKHNVTRASATSYNQSTWRRGKNVNTQQQQSGIWRLISTFKKCIVFTFVQVNNACATGSSALFLAKQLVEGGMADCVMALGFEKMQRGSLKPQVRGLKSSDEFFYCFFFSLAEFGGFVCIILP